MKKSLSFIFVLGVILACFSCKTVSSKALAVETITNISSSKNLNDDILYSIDYEIKNKLRNDFIIINLETAFDKYILKFRVTGDMKDIISNFMSYSKNDYNSNINNGKKKIGESSIYCFVENKKSEKIRMLVNEGHSDKVDFYILLKDGRKYLVFGDMHLTALNRQSAQCIQINSFLIGKKDVEAIVNFTSDLEKIEKIRKEKLAK